MSIEDNNSEHFEKWQYPDIQSFTEIVNFNESIIIQDNIIPDINISPIEKSLDDPLQETMQVLENLILELKHKIETIDQELTGNILNIIKTICEKIIFKEVSLDLSIFEKRIHEVLTKFQSNEKKILIHVSKDAFEKISMMMLPESTEIIADSSLNFQDLIIKTPVNQLEFILENELSSLLELD